jgi:hypothetical protein
MRMQRRFILGSSLVLITAAAALAACVGDDPSAAPGSDDASTPTDAAFGNDTTFIVSDSAPPGTDASDAAVETFDGSNPTCNGLFPQDAPMPATIECDGGAILSPAGGTISLGRYYLVDQKYPGVCPTDLTGYSDVIEITDTGDGGKTVNAALNGGLNERLTLAWALNAGSFSQYDICPSNALHVDGVGYSATSTTLIYFLPGFGNLTYQKF